MFIVLAFLLSLFSTTVFAQPLQGYGASNISTVFGRVIPSATAGVDNVVQVQSPNGLQNAWVWVDGGRYVKAASTNSGTVSRGRAKKGTSVSLSLSTPSVAGQVKYTLTFIADLTGVSVTKTGTLYVTGWTAGYGQGYVYTEGTSSSLHPYEQWTATTLPSSAVPLNMGYYFCGTPQPSRFTVCN